MGQRIVAAVTAVMLAWGWAPVAWAELVAPTGVAEQEMMDPGMTAEEMEAVQQADAVLMVQMEVQVADGGGVIDPAMEPPGPAEETSEEVISPEAEGGYDDVMAALIVQIDGEINTAALSEMELTASLDYLEFYAPEEGDASGTGAEEGDSYTAAEPGAVEPAAAEPAATEPAAAIPPPAVPANPVAPAAGPNPPPIVGTASGPTTIAGIQAMLRSQLPTLNAQLAGLQLARDRLVIIRDRAQWLFNRRAIARAELDHANAMVAWINGRIGRVNALVAIANAPAATAPGLVGAFNAVAMGRLNARVTFLEGEENRLINEINIANGLGGAVAQEERDRLYIALGFVRADLAQARQEKANGQATVTAGGIVLMDFDPAPQFRR